MSNRVDAIVERKIVGSPTMKSVLGYMARRASDDGSGVWTSKSNIARDTEFKRRTVQLAIKELIEKGLIEAVGKRQFQNGETDEYCINLEAVRKLESTRENDKKEACEGGSHANDIHTTCERGSHQGANDVHTNSPRITLKPSNYIKTGESASQSFEKFWKIYPKKVEKKGALSKFKKALKSATPQEIIKGAENYVKTKQVKDGFIKNPTTWLNNGCWTDEDPQSELSKQSRFANYV